MKFVSLNKLISELELEIVHRSDNFNDIQITNQEVNRPALQLCGYMKDFPFKAIQIIGKAEYHYYTDENSDFSYKRFDKIFSYDIPAIIYTHNILIDDRVINYAKKHQITILRTPIGTRKFVEKIENILSTFLAEETTVHAGLMEIYGIGVLIKGESSIGKSETALELITKGHRLVADDVVDIIKLDDRLRGECPESIRHFLEIRGIGIIDINNLYGVGAIKRYTFIDMVVLLEQWNNEKEYDRIGIDEYYTEILGIKLPQVTIPVKPGRNIAMIVEVAAMIRRQRLMGYNAAEELNNRLIESLKNS